MKTNTPLTPVGPGPEVADSKRFAPRYGSGGVPWFLVLKYLGFLSFFTWYVLEYQLPDYLEQGPGRQNQAPTAPADPPSSPR